MQTTNPTRPAAVRPEDPGYATTMEIWSILADGGLGPSRCIEWLLDHLDRTA